MVGIVAAVLWVACSPLPEGPPRGPASPFVRELAENHPGWAFADCAACHDLPTVHGGSFALEVCGSCHGGNGAGASAAPHSAPRLDPNHGGWGMTRCESCHLPHQGRYEFAVCGACHSGNGAPPRPENHWLSQCSDCHAGGSIAPWPAAHGDLAASAPRACLDCHR